MKKALSIALLSLAGVCPSFAVPAPEKCPSVEAIKSVPLTIPLNMGIYTVSSSADYDHDGNYWAFVLGFFKADSDEDAIAKANATLPLVYGNPSPEPNDYNEWVCMYSIRDDGSDTDDDLESIRIGMAMYIGNNEPSPDVIRHFMQRKNGH